MKEMLPGKKVCTLFVLLEEFYKNTSLKFAGKLRARGEPETL